MNDEVTGGDLLALWQVSKVQMPRIADVFVDASQMVGGGHGSGGDAVSGTSDADEAFTQTRTQPYGGGTEAETSGRVYPSWSQLRNELQHILALAAQNTLDAAAAADAALNSFRGTDSDTGTSVTAAGAEFDEMVKDPNEVDPNDPSQNPPTGADKPGTPDKPKESWGDDYESDGDKKKGE